MNKGEHKPQARVGLTTLSPRRLATVKEACGYAKMGHTKLYEKLNEGAIVAYRREGRTLIDLDSIDAMHSIVLKLWKPEGKARGTRRARRK